MAIPAQPMFAEQSGALPAAVGWVENLLLGTVGTALAILAIAFVGYAMLWGRVSMRDGVRVVLGCFILFGAPVIARGLPDLARDTSEPAQRIVIPVPPPRSAPSPSTRSNPFDPYAGASVPM